MEVVEYWKEQVATKQTVTDALEILCQQLETLTKALAEIQTPTPQNPTAAPTPPTLPNPSAKAPPAMKAKVALLPDFDGNCQKIHTFLSACTLYLQLCSNQFLTDKHKILWAMSYMKSGRASKWTKTQYQTVGGFPFTDWADFEEQFKLQFFPLDLETSVVNSLEGMLLWM
ncbi:hypothetical protein P691DRAFT_765185 [Macrolepiota fuliginosa MF-IS2]|uniref:Retrotransposon gag domain-containing protein n=1 Tax=Macrolepiota fuliginosa MF-IS2 TaxID=1400762 RepID=A0A9P6BWZ4_9AGAR|nr:hypothetical protein P691DRAFT_765185 [Macrolepiota fuliginosa MF-IS2]